MSLVHDFVAVFQLAENTRQRFKNAPQQYTSVTKDLENLSAIITNFRIQDLSEQQTSSLKGILAGCCDALKALEQELSQYHPLESSAPNVRDKVLKIASTSQWNGNRIERIRAQISTQIGLLNAFTLNHIRSDEFLPLFIINSRIIEASKISSSTSHAISDLNLRHETQQQEDERRKFAQWLTPIDYTTKHNDNVLALQPGTGRGFLESTEFGSWFGQGDQCLLMCPGIPGAGKTMMATIVIEHLRDKFLSEEHVGLAYVYFDYQVPQKSGDVHLSILKQLLLQSNQPVTAVGNLYKDCEQGGSRPSSSEVQRTLSAVLDQFSRLFVIIDALDECHGPEGRDMLLREIIDLSQNRKASMLLTYRPVPEILALFGEGRLKEISAATDDIVHYVDGRLPHMKCRVSNQPVLRDSIRRAIVNAVDGMFLVAKLHMDALCAKPTAGHVKKALLDLRNSGNRGDKLAFLYEQAMERINSQDEDSRALAHAVLSWTTHAIDPLTGVQLQHALATLFSTSELDRDFMPEIEYLLSICAGLITIDGEGVVHWIHYTTQEHFNRTWEKLLPSGQLDIARTCITYISFEAFESGRTSPKNNKPSHDTDFPLYGYAVRHWGSHLKRGQASPEMSNELFQQALEFFRHDGKVRASNEMFEPPLNGEDITGLHLCAFFDLKEMAQILLLGGHAPDPKDAEQLSPLFWAVIRGHEETARLFLGQTGVDINSEVTLKSILRDKIKMTPLAKAVDVENIALVELLLNAPGIEANCKDERGQTPLFRASIDGMEAMVETLLHDKRTDVNTTNHQGETPLWYAVLKNYEGVAKILLEKGKANGINEKDTTGMTPLHRAVQCKYEILAECLLNQQDIDVNVRNFHGQTPLTQSCTISRGWSPATFKLILKNEKVDINAMDNSGWTPLTAALRNVDMECLQLVLETDTLIVDPRDEKIRQMICSAIWSDVEGKEMDAIRLMFNTGKLNDTLKDGLLDEAWKDCYKNKRRGRLQFLEEIGYVPPPLLLSSQTNHML